jgi:6,7-dimethyl-8-ribityllumazine synthase
MNQSSQGLPIPTVIDGVAGSHKVAVIAACWHQDIVSATTDAIQLEFERRSSPRDCLELYRVPGAFEIPFHAMRLARTRRYDAIIACGFVMNGGIYRHEFVAAAVIDGLMRVQLDTDVPVFSAVLTPRDFHDHEEHQAFFKAHFVKKGIEVARACLNTLGSLSALDTAPTLSLDRAAFGNW